MLTTDMPWVKKRSRPHNPYWIAALIALSAVCVGVLVGYTRWGTTAAIVSLLEKELAATEAHIQVLEKRLGRIKFAASLPILILEGYLAANEIPGSDFCH